MDPISNSGFGGEMIGAKSNDPRSDICNKFTHAIASADQSLKEFEATHNVSLDTAQKTVEALESVCNDPHLPEYEKTAIRNLLKEYRAIPDRALSNPDYINHDQGMLVKIKYDLMNTLDYFKDPKTPIV